MFSNSISRFFRKNVDFIKHTKTKKSFCEKTEIKAFKPKYYADIYKITPPDHYNENYKLKFG